MEGGVKFIFKTLLKVPIIIMVSFAIFNVFAFSLSYFKILGISYVALQTAVENNYIPKAEYRTLLSYMDTLQTHMLEEIQLTCKTDKGTNNFFAKDHTSASPSENRVQYGEEVTITVGAHYRFVWPLQPKEQTTAGTTANAKAVLGYKAQGTGGDGAVGTALTEGQLEEARAKYEENPQNNIVISYTVPGLKYYPDLS